MGSCNKYSGGNCCCGGSAPAFTCGPCGYPATLTITIKYKNSSGGLTTSSGTWTFSHFVGGIVVGASSIPFNNSQRFGAGSTATVQATFKCTALTGAFSVGWNAIETSPTSAFLTTNDSGTIAGPASFTCSPLSEVLGNGTADINGTIPLGTGVGIVECDITP